MAIDIGSPAIARSNWFGTDQTIVTKENAANATGELDTVETYTSDVWNNPKVGTFSASGNVLTCHDSESLGNTNAGSKTTYTGLTIDVNAGEYIGIYAFGGSGFLQGVGTGYAGAWYVSGEYIDPTDSTTFTLLDGDTVSLWGTGTEAGGVVVEGSAAGEGIGLASSSAKLDVLASALGNGIGLSLASPFLIIPGLASGEGIGEATAQAILNVLAQADGSGIGLGTTEALLNVLAAAAASGEGLGEAEALLEVIAEAVGEGVGSGIVIVPGEIVEGEGAGSGVGTASVEALLDVLANAQGQGIGIGSTPGAIIIVVRIRRVIPGYTLGRVKTTPHSLGRSLDKYTLGGRIK